MKPFLFTFFNALLNIEVKKNTHTKKATATLFIRVFVAFVFLGDSYQN